MGLLDQIKEDLELHLKDQFGIYPEKSKVKLYDLPEWTVFNRSQRFSVSRIGYYNIVYNISHILNCSEAIQVLFHEHFGHGFHFEHSQTGKHLTTLEQKAHKEETAANPRTLEELEKFRATNPAIQELIIEKTRLLPECESFAIWMQHYLSNITGRQEEFEKTFRNVSKPLQFLTKELIKYSASYGEHALLYSMGFPKHYNKEIAANLLKKLYPTNDIKFALLYGSKKPHSDIDVFVVSDNIQDKCHSWLDISLVNTAFFEELVSKLDISATDPLFSGELILGDEKYLEQTKKKILETPITPEQIAYHKQHAKKAKQMAQQTTNPQEHKTAMRYNKSYIANAKELSKGRKALTLQKLIIAYPNYFNQK